MIHPEDEDTLLKEDLGKFWTIGVLFYGIFTGMFMAITGIGNKDEDSR